MKNLNKTIIIMMIMTIIIIITLFDLTNGLKFFNNNNSSHHDHHDQHASKSSTSSSSRMKKFFTSLFESIIIDNKNINRNDYQSEKHQLRRQQPPTQPWNEFMEEQNNHQQQIQEPMIVAPLSSPSPSLISSYQVSQTQNNQSLIDETNDPNSEYYISMITSNVSGNFNRSNHHHRLNQLNSNHNHHSSSISSLFNYAFSTSTPPLSRIMHTTKHPLITYINMTNLEDLNTIDSSNTNSEEFQLPNHDETPFMSSKKNIDDNLAQQQHEPQEQILSNQEPPHQQPTSLFNSADPHQSMLTSSANNSTTITSSNNDNQTKHQAQLFNKKRLPECATQQVCSAYYVKSNHTQRLCDCSRDSNYDCNTNSPYHSSSLNNDGNATNDTDYEEHIIDLTRKQEMETKHFTNTFEAYTQVRLCENLRKMKLCKHPTDWTIMALQSERTGKAHFVVVCKCPATASFEGPFTHKHPPYARFPGIRVYGMLCNQGNRKSKQNLINSSKGSFEIDFDNNNNGNGNEFPEFPWELAYAVINSTTTQGFW